MNKVAAVFPVLPGKDARTVAALLRRDPSEYIESRRHSGILLERAYEMRTPMGMFLISYIESERPFAEVVAAGAISELPFDRDFVTAVRDVHGIDITQPPLGEPAEVIGDWEDDSVTARKRGLAFCAPLMPGASDTARAFCQEAFRARREEFTASRRALQVTRETVVLNHTPAGDVAGVYIEGDDPVQGNRGFAASQSPFDVWFKERCARIFPPDIDFNQPLPPITEVFDSQEILVAR